MSEQPLSYLALLSQFREARASARPGLSSLSTLPDVEGKAPAAIVFPPHPDDECIIGSWALRLRETGWRVHCAALGMGSDQTRANERKDEWQQACHTLGFEPMEALLPCVPNLRPSLAQEKQAWDNAVHSIADFITETQARLVIVPHSCDWHPAHQAAAMLVANALQISSHKQTILRASSHYWGQMDKPNRLILLEETHVARLMEALACHQGEIARNPYHLSLPAYFADSLRWATERLQGARTQAPDSYYGAAYQVELWANGEPRPVASQILNTQEAAVCGALTQLL